MKSKTRSFLREAYGTMYAPPTLAVWFSAIVVAVVAGPFGTLEALTTGQRTVFWGATVSVSVFLGYTVRAVAAALIGHDRPGLFDTVSVGLMTVVFAPFVWVLARAVGDDAPAFAPLLADVFVVTAAVMMVRRLTPGIEPRPYRFFQPEAAPARVTDATSEPVSPRLSRRLPEDARGRILRLAARDHFVDVVTDAGVAPLRMRLRDAVEEMVPVAGCPLHRSHWVALAAIDRVERDGPQRLVVVMVNGDRVPVSRGFRPNLENAGIIGPPCADG